MYPQGYLREHSSILLWVMRLLDVVVSMACCLFGFYLVFGSNVLPAHYQIAIIFSILLVILVFHAYSLYRAWRGVDYIQEMTSVLLAWTSVFAILVFLSVITKTSSQYSRAWLVIWYTSGGVGLLLMRYCLRAVLRRLRSKGFNLRHIVIIASGDIGSHVFDKIRKTPETGFNIVAYFCDDTTQLPTIEGVKYGTLASALAYLQKNQVDQVWLAMPLKDSDRIEFVMNSLKNSTVDIRLVPDVFGFRLINHSISSIAGMSVINLSVTPMEGINLWLKIVEDKVIATTVLLLLSPVFLLIALLVKLSGPGPIFYKQKRLSWNGKEFKMYKFRTMPVNIEASSGPVWATANENRATTIGSYLRRSSLDELPQIWNVLKGDMSVVGPRPERRVFVEKFKEEIPLYMQKHMVKAGITGWAQVNGWRGDTDLAKRIEHDLYYIDNWSLWLDLKIILLTLFKGFSSKNAY